MTERSILAYFNTPDQAHKALEQLKQLRLVDSRIERFDGMPGDGIDVMTNPIRSHFDSLGELTLNGEFENRSAGILSAASVSASGYSSGGLENRVSGRDVLLTAIVEEEDYERAYNIVRESGAL
ncbi:hypothetical protein GE107_19360 [Cohnella sp. CFH 77786]|uniref:hypothetical protein n=1 Tax=Cohnella sp. CFH 77786 TaxID=2662265 RepID=UPI001C60E0E4|nr:hypothetical protein [Cohnella sp. CFH 77786]MBW5448210.1 hypothetical protein [Cohnella sp. CFH 77786]